MSHNSEPLVRPATVASERNPNFGSFILNERELASSLGIKWEIALDDKGVAVKGGAWDLRRIVNDGRPEPAVLRTFSLYPEALFALAARNPTAPRRAGGPVSPDWQDFIKAVALEYLVVRKKGIPFVAAASLALRFLAAVAEKEPWLVTAEDVQLTCELADACQPSKGTSIVLQGLLSTVVDRLHLFNDCPLMGLVKRSRNDRERRSKFYLAQDALATSLAQRKAEEKLPEQRAFWELIRIVFTEKPRSLNDALRFAMVKVLLFSGLRLGEVALLPLDWKRTRSFLDAAGRPAGKSGGISEALMLRHFAEKQGTTALYETTQFVPDMFRDELERALEQIVKLTAPLRATLRAQHQTGRLFPMYAPDALVDAVEMYGRLTGNPVWAKKPSDEVLACVVRYRKSFERSELAPLMGLQKGISELNASVSRYYSPESRGLGLVLRNHVGEIDTDRGVKNKFIRVSDAETFVRDCAPTKVPTLADFTLDNGTKVAPWEMLFLLPQKAVGEGRGQTVVDPGLTFSVGVASGTLLQTALGDVTRSGQSLFNIYGQTDEDRSLKILSHSFRHLQNTELFRLGVADTVISKRFNRRSVAQSYEYDHRSLAEEMDVLELPDAWAEYLGDSKSATVAKLMVAGRAEGPIVREFRKIQQEEGDEAALQFLAAEADGFHATPYGYCLNSFTVDPCPKHLECFTGCRHLSATNLPENHRNILTLHGRIKAALEAAQARSPGSVGRSNQIAHAAERLRGLERLLNTDAGERVFPEGPDLSLTVKRRSVLGGT
jgi:hypothetical protein